MKFEDINRIYFLGIGGIGMSAIARYFNSKGIKISGYDKTPTPLTSKLISEGIEIHFEEDVAQIPSDVDLVVLTPAIPKNHKELIYFQENNFKILKRSEILGIITKNTFTIAIAGTHGKTSVTSLVSHILNEANLNIAAFIGGISQNYGSNIILHNDSNITVVEADEFDRSFLTLHPDLAVITSMDADHLDIYKNKENLHESFNQFASQIKKGGKLFVNEGLEKYINAEIEVLTYGVYTNSRFYATNIRAEGGFYTFDFSGNDIIKGIKPGSAAYYNVINSIPAIAIAKAMGVENDVIKKALNNYQGVKRRFEYIINTENLVFIDDYAHHPTEIEACIKSVRNLFENRKVTGIFQPHLFSRTKDFADGFAEALSKLDEVILLDIYPARELPIEGVTSKMLLDKIDNPKKFLFTKEELIRKIGAWDLDVLLTIGAGDIDALIEPIKNELLKK
ncbi:MAG: UDP-N-acetylmuramate--L-alanine ligase [Bacteroidota bacterium]